MRFLGVSYTTEESHTAAYLCRTALRRCTALCDPSVFLGAGQEVPPAFERISTRSLAMFPFLSCVLRTQSCTIAIMHHSNHAPWCNAAQLGRGLSVCAIAHVDERGRDASVPCAACAPDAVYVVIDIARHVVYASIFSPRLSACMFNQIRVCKMTRKHIRPHIYAALP
eukprot:SAG11_NODE_1048_length_6038_cov_8.260818_8_plen_168_part_00